jgi:hypothetical protein
MFRVRQADTPAGRRNEIVIDFAAHSPGWPLHPQRRFASRRVHLPLERAHRLFCEAQQIAGGRSARRYTATGAA